MVAEHQLHLTPNSRDFTLNPTLLTVTNNNSAAAAAAAVAEPINENNNNNKRPRPSSPPRAENLEPITVPSSKQRRLTANVHRVGAPENTINPKDPHQNMKLWMIPCGDIILTSNVKGVLNYLGPHLANDSELKTVVLKKRQESLSKGGHRLTRDNKAVTWTKPTAAKQLDCPNLVETGIVGVNPELKGVNIAHEYANGRRSFHTVTVDPCSTLNEARDAPTLPLWNLHLHFAMVYEPDTFTLGTSTLNLSPSMLERQCNTFLREPCGTCYILLRPKDERGDVTRLAEHFDKMCQPLHNADGLKQCDPKKPFLMKMDESSIAPPLLLYQKDMHNVGKQAFLLFDFHMQQLQNNEYIPNYVLVGTSQTMQMCFVFFQLWYRLQLISQQFNQWKAYFERHSDKDDWIMLLAKQHFFGALARPQMRFDTNALHDTPCGLRGPLSWLGERELQLNSNVLPHCVTQLLQKHPATQSIWQQLFVLSEHRPLQLDYSFDLRSMGYADHYAINEELHHSVYHRFLPPVLVQTTERQQNVAFKTQLHYLLLQQNEPEPFGTWDVECAAAASRVMWLFPHLAWKNQYTFPKDRRPEKENMLRQWYYSSLEPYNLLHQVSPGHWPQYPTTPELHRPNKNSTDLVGWLTNKVDVTDGHDETPSVNIQFEPVRWDAEVIRYCLNIHDDDGTTASGMSRKIRGRVSTRMKQQALSMAAEKGSCWNDWIRHYEQASTMSLLYVSKVQTSPVSDGSQFVSYPFQLPCALTHTALVEPPKLSRCSLEFPSDDTLPSSEQSNKFLAVNMFCSYQTASGDDYDGVVIGIRNYHVSWMRMGKDRKGTVELEAVKAVCLPDSHEWLDLYEVTLLCGELPVRALERLRNSFEYHQSVLPIGPFTCNPCGSRDDFNIAVKPRIDDDSYRPVFAGMRVDIHKPDSDEVEFGSARIVNIVANNRLSDTLEIKTEAGETKRMLCKDVSSLVMHTSTSQFLVRSPIFVSGYIPTERPRGRYPHHIVCYQEVSSLNGVQAKQSDSVVELKDEWCLLPLLYKIHIVPDRSSVEQKLSPKIVITGDV